MNESKFKMVLCKLTPTVMLSINYKSSNILIYESIENSLKTFFNHSIIGDFLNY